jgi:tetratricopeptide (TPR) repeat protein
MSILRVGRLPVLLIAFSLTAPALLTACGGAKGRFESHLRRGESYLASGNLDKAGIEFRNASQIEPKNAVALYYNGRVAEARGNIRGAYGMYQAAIDADGNYAPARAGAGKMLVFGHEAQRALETVAPGLKTNPESPDLLAVRAAAYHVLKQTDQARADAEHAMRIAPDNQDALAILAALYCDGKEYPRAIDLVKAALQRKPTSTDLHEVLINIYLLSGDPDSATALMRKVVELKPNELAARQQLATHLIRMKDPDGAQRVLEEAVRSFSSAKQTVVADQAKLLLVEFITRQRSREQGEGTLRDYIKRDPDDLDLRLSLGQFLLRTGDTPGASVAYRDVIKRDGLGPKGLAARDRLAAIELDAGHLESARQLVGEVLQKSPRDDDALILHSTLQMQAKKPDDAIADLRTVLRSQPGSVPLQRSLAAAYMAKGETALAEETLRAAVRSAPTNTAVRLELARLLASTKRLPDSVTLLEESAKIAPDDVPIREALIRGYLASGSLQEAKLAAVDLRTRQPKSEVGFYYAGRIDLAQHDLAGATQEYQAAVKAAPGNPRLVMEAAAFFEKQGRIDDAIASYEGLYKENERARPLAANNLAMLLVTYKKDRESLDRARSMTEVFADSTNGSLLDTRGWVYFKRGEYQEALPVLQKALERAPDSKVIHFHLAMAQLQLGMREPARSNLEIAVGGPDSFQGVEEARNALAGLKGHA